MKTYSLLALPLVLAAGVAVAGGLIIETAQGTVTTVDAESVTMQVRQTAGKKLTLKLTGTSRVVSVALELRAGKMVPVQRDMEAKNLETGQRISVVYLAGADPILLSAVAERGSATKE